MHDEHCRVVEHKKTGDSGMKNNRKKSDAGSCCSGPTLKEAQMEMPETMRVTVTE
jgi:hypothetical protein